MAPFNSENRQTPIGRKNLLDILDTSYTSRLIADFISNFVAMATGLVAVEFVLRHSIGRPRKTTAIRKDIADISYIGRVIADFDPNFVAIVTGVGRSGICLASFNSPTPKTPCYTQRSRGYLLYRPSYSRFCPKFRCHVNGGWSQWNLSGIIQ